MITLKVCELTTLPDAKTCAALGAHAVGVRIEGGASGAPSQRLVASVVEALAPRTLVVGVVSPALDDAELERIKCETGVACWQFEGHLAAARLARHLPHAYLALPVAALEPALEALAGDYVMIRAEPWPGAADEAAWRRLRALARTKRLALSAPFSAASAREALARVRPFCLDLRPAPGTEGRFDARRVEALLEAMREAPGALAVVGAGVSECPSRRPAGPWARARRRRRGRASATRRRR